MTFQMETFVECKEVHGSSGGGVAAEESNGVFLVGD